MVSLLTSPVFADNVQNSIFQVISEGSLKAVARPVITLYDKNGTPESRKYSATKELIFQTLSIAFYIALVIPFVQKGGYKLLRKKLKHRPEFAKLKEHENVTSFLKARKAAKTPEEEAKFVRPKGAIELVNMIGSGIILTVLAPIVVTRMMHPIMKSIAASREAKAASKVNQDGDMFTKTSQASKRVK